MHVETVSDRGVMLLIQGLWFHPSVWAPWLEELDEAGYDAEVLSWARGDRQSGDGSPAARADFDACWPLPGDASTPSGPGQS